MLDLYEVFDRIESSLAFTQRDVESFGIPYDECEWILYQFVRDCMEEIEAGYNTINANETHEGRKDRYMLMIANIRSRANEIF